MIKKYIYTTVLLLGAISCSKENDLNSDMPLDDSIITFASKVSDTDFTTKGTPITSADDITSLGVIGFINGETYINNREATKASDTSWSLLNPVVYWPEDDNVTFFTYSPYDQARIDNVGNHGENKQGVSHVTATSTQLQLKYTVPITCTDQPDLMVAYKADAAKGDGAVELEKKHALAAIGFRTYNEFWRGVKYIKMKNVVAEGTLTYKPSDTANPLTWELEAPSSLEYQPDLLVTPELVNHTPIITQDGYLMMIPQNLANVTIEIGLVDIYGVETSETIEFTENDVWEVGQIYMYDIKMEYEGRWYQGVKSGDIYVYNEPDGSDYSSTSSILDEFLHLDDFFYTPEKHTVAFISPSISTMPEGVCVDAIDESDISTYKGDPYATFRIDHDSECFFMFYLGNQPQYENSIDYFVHLKAYYLQCLGSIHISNSDCKIEKVEYHNIVVEATVNLKTGEWDVENGKKGTLTFNINTIFPNGLCCSEKYPYMTFIPQTISDDTFFRLYTTDGRTKDIYIKPRTFNKGGLAEFDFDVSDLMD